MTCTLSVLVENQAGVLSRVASLFARRGFNIDSLAVGETENPSLSRITIVVSGDVRTVEQIEKQLNKLIHVVKIKNLDKSEYFSRQVTLFKVMGEGEKRSEIIKLAEITGAKILDITETTLTLELCDTLEKCLDLQNLLEPYGIKEIAKTGCVAIEKGSNILR